jgi:hypothetical protein
MKEHRNKVYNKNERTRRPKNILKKKMEYTVFEVEIIFIGDTKKWRGMSLVHKR